MASSEDNQDDPEYSDDFAEDTHADASKSGAFSGAGGAGDVSDVSAGSSAGSGGERHSELRSASEGDEEDPHESTQHDHSKFSSMLSSSMGEAGAAGDSHISARSASARSASKDEPSGSHISARSASNHEASQSQVSAGASKNDPSEDEQYSDSFEDDKDDTALDSGPITSAAARLTPREMETPHSRASSKELSPVSSAGRPPAATAHKPESPQATAPEKSREASSEAAQVVSVSGLPPQGSSDGREHHRQNQSTAARQAFTKEEITAFQQDAAPLPSEPEHWRADVLESALRNSDFSRLATLGLPMPPHGKTEGAPGKPLSPVAQASPGHDAVPRHLKAHAWDLASLGQEAPPPRQAWPLAPPAQSVADAWPLQPNGGGARGFGGKPNILPAMTETQLVDVLAQRFLEQRRAPALEKRERAAYQEMLQQVAWTALEPASAQELASLLSQSSQAPVSSAEALRAFRRCLHAILTDDRVLDIIEHQMVLHFSRLARPVH